jgi:hypothetical protein
MVNQSKTKILTSATSQVHQKKIQIDICPYFVWYGDLTEPIQIEYLPTNKITPDILTKALQRDAHYSYMKVIDYRANSAEIQVGI